MEMNSARLERRATVGEKKPGTRSEGWIRSLSVIVARRAA